MHQLSLKQLREGLTKQTFSATEVCQHFIERIDRLEPQLNSFITTTPEQALQAAAKAQSIIDAGKAGPLTGIPIVHKDIFCTQGIKTSCGSKMLDNFIAPYDATVVTRLNQAGMVMLGKSNMDDFAMGSSNEHSHYGAVKNPWDLQTVPGGSSGGSAAAVAAGLSPCATGTDTGGSIRQPAAFCGITGLKPTYGAVSRYGMVAFASSLDQAGPMAKSAEDVSVLFDAMAGHDNQDSTSVKRAHSPCQTQLNDSIKGLTLGLPQEFFHPSLDPAMRQRIEDVANYYQQQGITLKEISLPSLSHAIACYYIIAPAEASSNLSRYDGIRFGHRSERGATLEQLYVNSRSEGFGPEVKRRIMIGSYVLSSGYFDAYYVKAQKLRRLIRDEFIAAFSEVDAILSPTTPAPAFALGTHQQNPVDMYLSDTFTIAVNLAGLPALSMPCGFIDGLPVGAQLIGNHFAEARLLNLAHRFQQETDHHQQQPQLR